MLTGEPPRQDRAPVADRDNRLRTHGLPRPRPEMSEQETDNQSGRRDAAPRAAVISAFSRKVTDAPHCVQQELPVRSP